MVTTIYIDASFSDNRSFAGYGAVIIKNNKRVEMSGVINGASNSTEAEVFAVAEVLELLEKKGDLIIYNDNMACVDVMNGGKLNKKNKKINKALSTIRKHKGSIRGIWVRGHHLSKDNCRADELAREQLFLFDINSFKKVEIYIYIGVEYNENRIGYSYVIKNRDGRLLYSSIENIRNGGVGSFSYAVSKSLGKLLNNDTLNPTHLYVYSNTRSVLSLFNTIIRHKKKDYKKILRNNVENQLFQSLKKYKIAINKSVECEDMKMVIKNARYSLNS